MKNSRFIKWISLVLAVAMVMGTIPVSGMMTFAAEEENGIAIQYLSGSVVKGGVEMKIRPDESSDTAYTGVTDENGVWKTAVSFEELSEVFYVYINGDMKTVSKPETAGDYLIINDDEKTWANNVLGIISVTVDAEKTVVSRSEAIKLTATVKGTPSTYQWYRNSNKIEGATAAVYIKENAAVTDGGEYTCKVTDIYGDSRTAAGVKITVNEKEASDVSLKAYADGSEITGFISRDVVDKVQLKLSGLPEDAVVTKVKYYVNDICLSSETSNLSYVFGIEAGVEEYDCAAEVYFDKYYAPVKVSLSTPVQAPMLQQSAVMIGINGVTYDSSTGAYELTYAPEGVTFEVTVSGGSGTGDYSLAVTQEKKPDGSAANTGYVAKIKSEGSNKWKVTVKNAGSFRLDASKAGDGNYKNADYTTALFNVAKATTEGFAFATEAPEAVTYNANGNEFTNSVVEGFSDVEYSIVSGDCAEIDAATGKLTIKKAGTVTVKATLAETDNYTGATATYELTVNKAKQAIEFEDKAATVYYGEAYSRVAKPVEDASAADGFGYNHDENAEVKYSIVVAEGEEAIATVKADGSLEFSNQKLGAVTVKAVLDGNDCYESAEAEYTVTVSPYSIENGYEINGEKLVADGDWYSGDITVTPAENHLISKTNNLGDENEWTSSIVIDTEGSENGLDIYIKNIETGAISEKYEIANENVMLDKSVPHSLKVNYKTEAWYQDVLEIATFGYYNSIVTFTLEAADDYSGIEYFIWKFVSEDDGTDEISETRVEATKDGDKYVSDACVLGDESNLQEFRGRISFSAYDFAGNSAEAKEKYVIVVDTTTPELEISANQTAISTVNSSYPFVQADSSTVDPIEIYNGETEITLSVVEKNFFEKNAAVTVNGEDVSASLSWKSAGDNNYAVLTFDEDGDYAIELTYEDIFGEDITNSEIKTTYTQSKKICVDTTLPVVSYEINEASFETENAKYYNNDVTVKFTVAEKKFRPADIVISDVDGFGGMSAENKEYLNKAENWTYDEENGTYTASVTFKAENADKEYCFNVDYTDLAANAAEQINSGVFVIDTINPIAKILTSVEPQKTVNNAYPYIVAEKNEADSIDIFSETVDVTFKVVEKNFFADRVVVTVNGEDVSGDLQWTTVGEENTAVLSFDEEDDYSISLTYTDIFGASAEEKTKYEDADLIAVDKTKPEITIELSEEKTENESVKYYNGDVVAKITVAEEKFRPEELVISGEEGFNGISEENKQYLLNSNNWMFDEDSGTYTTSVLFAAEDAEGFCKFFIDYTDFAGNVAEQAASDTFNIDITAPVISVDYGAAKILNSDCIVIESFDISESNNITIYDNKDIVVTVKITEKNFDPEKAAVMLSKNFGEAKLYDFDGEWKLNGDVYVNTVTLSDRAVYKLAFSCTDRGTNDAKELTTPKIEISDSIPSITFETTPLDEDGYYNCNEVNVTVKIFEEYFAQENVDIKVEVEDIKGNKIEVESLPDYNNNEWAIGENFCNSLDLTFKTEGRYKITVKYKNVVGDDYENVCDFVIDRTEPTHKVEYSEPVAATILNIITFNLYNSDKPVTVTVTAEDNISGVDNMNVKYPNTYLPEDYYGTQEFEIETNFYADKTKADAAELVGEWTINRENVSVQAKANIEVIATDNAGNSTAEEDRVDDKDIAVDTVPSTISLSYGDAKILDSRNNVVSAIDETQSENFMIYDKKDIVVTVTIKEPHFNPDAVECMVSKDFAEAVSYSFNGEWVSDGIVHTNTVTISGEGMYRLTVSNTDFAENEASCKSLDMVISESKPSIRYEYSPARTELYFNETVTVKVIVFDEYFSEDRAEITVIAKDAARREFAAKYGESGKWETETTADGKANIYTLTFDEKNEGMYKINTKYTNAVGDADVYERVIAVDNSDPIIKINVPEKPNAEFGIHMIITIDEDNYNIDNFDAPAYGEEGFVAEKLNIEDFTLQFDGFDVTGKTVYYPEEKQTIIDYFNNIDNWDSVWVNGKYQNTLVIKNLKEATHKAAVSGQDRALNKSTANYDATVDHSAPYEITIKYSEPISIEKVKNGKTESEIRYYDDKIKVTVTAVDTVSGCTLIEWVYQRESGASDSNAESLRGFCHLGNEDSFVSSEGRTTVAEFYLPADKVEAIRGNLTVRATDRKGNTSEAFTDKTTLVIDNTKPEVNFEYSPSEPKKADGDFPEGGSGYYDSAVTVSVIVKEANFVADPKNVTNADGSSYEGMVLTCNNERYNGAWQKNGDTWRANIELSNDDVYVIKAKYTDPSGNEAAEKETGEIVIDRNAPKITVEYSPNNPVASVGERNYFNEDQTATIKIEERNFNPADVVATVWTSKIGGEEVESDLAAALADASSWKREGDVYTATINYSTDGNYRFDIEYTDPSGNAAEDYAGDELTVDKSAPSGLIISYGTEIAKDNDTYYYDAPVKVIVTATDEISGIKAFDYTYVSSVNNQSVKGTAKPNVNGENARAEFYVPADDVEQFKGTVKVTATDNSGNSTAAKEGKGTVVYDNIAPIGRINVGNGVTTVNGVKYFSGSVNATVEIVESNFDGNDVVVFVDGNETSIGNWSNSGDTWTASVNVSSDGQHKISVSYTDKSGNQMASTESENFVIDHTAPVIVVNGVKNNAAYSDEKIGFTITAQDENFSSSGLEAELTVVVQKEDGKFETKKVDIGNAFAAAKGYTIDVDNLEEDGIYTLVCKASDLCGNSASGISADGKTESSITFSVNRKGSTYLVDDTTEKIVDGSGYTQSINGDIVITEINVAPIESHSVKLNGEELKQGEDYSVNSVGADGEWYKYEYTIFAKNFAEEKDYSIVVSSTDGTKNTGYSDLNGRPIKFTVDKTAPAISVSGLEANGSYKTDKLIVNVAPFDAGGMVGKFEVYADDELVATYTGAELMNLMAESADGMIAVEIPEGSYDRIRFVCTDEAGNVYDSDKTYKDITVSPNQLVLLWSRDWFKACVIGGFAAAAGLIVLILIKKKKKKEA